MQVSLDILVLMPGLCPPSKGLGTGAGLQPNSLSKLGRKHLKGLSLFGTEKRGSKAAEKLLFTLHSMLKPNRKCLLSAECPGMESCI